MRFKSALIAGATAFLLTMLLSAQSAFAAAGPLAPGAPYFTGQTDRWTVGGSWHFKADPADAGQRERWQRETQFIGWSQVTVPNAFNAGDSSEASHRGAVGWYGREFVLPPSPARSQWVLRFESVNYFADVYLNGRLIGHHSGGYVPFEIDASTMRRGVNRLVVRVDSRLNDWTVPPVRDTRLGTPNGGWWNFGGLLREVILRRIKRVDISNVAVHPKIACATCPARIDVRATLRNHDKKRVRVQARGSFGSQALRFPKVLLRGESELTVSRTITVENPLLWTIEDPNLYPVSIGASIGRSTVSGFRMRTGIRSLKVTNAGRMLLNNHPVQLRGTSVHEFTIAEGAALSRRSRENQMKMAEELGSNLIRAHYPLHPATYEQGDRDGVMFWVQNPVFRVPDTVMRTSRYRTTGVRMLKEMVQANKHHPSVLVWSIGNEILAGNITGIDRYASSAVKAIRQLDPDGISAIDVAAAPASVLQQPGYRRVKAIGLNEYFGWYAGTNGTAVNREELGPFLTDFHEMYPRQALFVTEFGAEASRDGPADEKGTYDFQTQFLDYHIRTIAAKPFVNGILPWMLQDYWVRPAWDGGNPDPVPPMSSKGMRNADGTPKPAFERVAQQFRDTPPLRP